jgi:hypothetical protein
MKNILFVILGVFALTTFASAQPRLAERPAQQAANGPTSVEAKYEGGIYGSTGREKGTLKLDDVNKRLVFYRKSDQREMFSIPYDALVVVYPDSKVSTSQTGNVVSRVPLPGAGLAGLLSTRAQYLIVNFDDPDIDTRGTANFKFDDKKKLLAFIDTLGNRAKMKQRGDAFYRPRGSQTF